MEKCVVEQYLGFKCCYLGPCDGVFTFLKKKRMLNWGFARSYICGELLNDVLILSLGFGFCGAFSFVS